MRSVAVDGTEPRAHYKERERESDSVAKERISRFGLQPPWQARRVRPCVVNLPPPPVESTSSYLHPWHVPALVTGLRICMVCRAHPLPGFLAVVPDSDYRQSNVTVGIRPRAGQEGKGGTGERHDHAKPNNVCHPGGAGICPPNVQIHLGSVGYASAREETNGCVDSKSSIWGIPQYF